MPSYQQYIDLVETAYQLLLGRDADSEGLAFYATALESGQPPAEFLRILANSPEYQKRYAVEQINDDPEVRVFMSPEVEKLSTQLQACDVLFWDTYQEIWSHVFANGQPLIVGQAAYGETHHQRFWELFNAVALLLRQRPDQAQVIEFGASQFSAFYKRLFPTIELHIADRPVAPDYAGFTADVCYHVARCDDFHTVDLTDLRTMDAAFASMGSFDLLVFAEILEHLAINPVDLLRRLLCLLKPDGWLYLTTPNFFCQRSFDLIARCENPNAVYPPGEENWDAHYHYREYALKELLRFSQQAGAKVAAFYLSDCWDNKIADIAESRRGNLVLLLQREMDESA